MRNHWEEAAPSEWISLLNEQADLDAAFEALEDWNHFHGDTIRGRIRSLQLRPQEAWGHFEKAASRSASFSRSSKNVLRLFSLKVYRFENAILEESLPLGGQPSRVEECFGELLNAEMPALEPLKHVQLHCRAAHHLHRADYHRARRLFLMLIRDGRRRRQDEQTGYYLGAAAALRSLGAMSQADRQMENACLSIPVLASTFNMGVHAATATALLRLWNREDEAIEWEGFVSRLEAPARTRELFRERTRRIVERSRCLERIFLF
jgi:hypothetical protein